MVSCECIGFATSTCGMRITELGCLVIRRFLQQVCIQIF